MSRLQTLLKRLLASRRALIAFGAATLGVALMGLAVFALASRVPAASRPLPTPTARPAPVAEAPPADADTLRGDDTPFAGIAQPPPEPAQRSGPVAHIVQEGETVWQIAERYHLRPETILWANDVANADLILVGQTLLIPPADGIFYTVQPGDRLVDIAERHGIELSAIASANGLRDPDQVQAGTSVFLPGARPLSPTLAAGGAGDSTRLQAAVASGGAAAPASAAPAEVQQLVSAGWLATQRPTVLYKTAGRNARPLHELPAGARLERLEGLSFGRIEVRDPGDGRTRQAMTGWVSVDDVGVSRAPAPHELPQAYPDNTAMNIAHVFAPYRSQLDGSPYAEANCGPTTIGMALAAFGVEVSSGKLRAEALDAQGVGGHNVGTLITALAKVVERHGLQALGLYDGDGSVHRWTLDEIRAHLRQGHPVVVQVRYRALPGRGGAFYYGDHYILVTGVLPHGFLYNDSVDSDGIGWDRVISGERLEAAMEASDQRYARAAFAVSP